MKPGKITIEVKNLSKNFGSVQALNEIMLDIEPGKLHGFIGPDGAGKTTLFRIFAGLLHNSKGKVQFFSEDKEIPFIDLRPFIAYMPSRPSLYPDLSIDEHLRFFRDLYSLSGPDFKKKSEELLEITKLEKFRDRKIMNLSGGMYKKVGLMCALLQSPSVMLLDEPTNGVDPISRREFWEMLYRLTEQKILILISTAYMDEVERCAVVHLMDSGKIIMSGEPDLLLAKENAAGFDEIFIRRAKS